MIEESTDLYVERGETVLKLITKNSTPPSKVTYSMPVNYGDQVPLLLKIEEDTSSKINGYNIIDDKNSPNKLIIFNVDSLEKHEKITIHFTYWVLIKNHKYQDVPKDTRIPKENELPDDVKKWLLSTKSIQSDNLLIRIMARLIRGYTNNLLNLVKKIAFYIAYNRPILTGIRRLLESKAFLRNNFLPPKYWTGLCDAFSTLLFGGLCTSQVNLGVALLRANGVPARVLIVNPIFSHGRQFDWLDSLHYAIEFYMPNYGWIRAEPGRILRRPKNLIIIRIIYPEEEYIAGNGLSYYGGKEPWFWFSNKNIILDFPEDLITYYKKPKGSGVPATSRNIVSKVKAKKEIANKIFILSQNSWEIYVNFFGKRLNSNYSNKYETAIEFQKQALEDLINSEIKNSIKNMKKAYDLFKEINM